VELTTAAGPGTGDEEARKRAEQIASELATLVAQEHRRAEDEQARREAAEATAAELTRLLANEQATVERERVAREQAEAQAREVLGLSVEEPPGRRFVNAHRPAPPTRPRFQRAR
jgi:hypothetical protein